MYYKTFNANVATDCFWYFLVDYQSHYLTNAATATNLDYLFD